MTHADKIKQLLNDGEYHCAKELEAISWSKHKRVRDAEAKYKIKIETRSCVHLISGAHDYRIMGWKPPITYRPASNEEVERMKKEALMSYPLAH